MDRDTLWQLFQRTGLPEAYTLMAQVPWEHSAEEQVQQTEYQGSTAPCRGDY